MVVSTWMYLDNWWLEGPCLTVPRLGCVNTFLWRLPMGSFLLHPISIFATQKMALLPFLATGAFLKRFCNFCSNHFCPNCFCSNALCSNAFCSKGFCSYHLYWDDLRHNHWCLCCSNNFFNRMIVAMITCVWTVIVQISFDQNTLIYSLFFKWLVHSICNLSVRQNVINILTKKVFWSYENNH